MQILQAAIPSPTVSVVHLGPLSVHLYALCIVAGILVALWLTDRRWRARGGEQGQVGDVAGWAVLFGIVGGRLYHVVTDPELYFGSGKHPLDAVKIWDGGLGIWGAIALGALGAWIGCRRHQMDFAAFADAAAPGVLLAQAVGRWGNWFNNELYGRATSLPWKLEIHELDVATGKATRDAAGHAVLLGYYHPTFLYEMLWSLLVVAVLLVLDQRRLLGRWQVLALYVMGYTFGRFFVELLRDDHANRIAGLRVNSWVSILVFLAALAWFLRNQGEPRSVAVPEGAVPTGAEDAEETPEAETPEADKPDADKLDADKPEADKPDGASADSASSVEAASPVSGDSSSTVDEDPSATPHGPRRPS
ncbi:prolipoprotein diacylglyceryl transferase [Jatrophihabitans sp.]|uniref:prolipoprotein diacylglyceryl transferase n=1 Tax=Jatrophihabitans sp. TaxID=1932789 RepID=UPI002C3158B8|nr:prolipoprotein diacylglyceryl transferase [Jatrophihabitans sp.]